MLRQRVLTALAGGPLFLVTAWVGGIPFQIMVVGLGILGYLEFAYLVRFRGHRVILIPGSLLGIALVFLFYSPRHEVLVAVALAAISVVAWKLAAPNAYSILDLWVTILGTLYLFGFLGFLIGLRMLPGGFGALALLVMVVWASDTAAYFAGRAFGRHRLWPRVSPAKTWEGGLAGLLAATLVGAIATGILGKGITLGIIVGGVGSLAGQLGDLTESALKRYAGVKDSGNLIPGHGGVLDRFDSLIMASPFVYALVRFVGEWKGGF